MIIVDAALEKREKEGNPVRVGLVGAGYMGRGIALQLLTPMVGMRLVAICNRSLSGAGRAYRKAGVEAVRTVGSVPQIEHANASCQYGMAFDPTLLSQAEGIDAISESTGEIGFGALMAMRAMERGKH